jgi:outer membrane protein assembly factor BamE (lipoprotein component of BamABCDE complex)
MKNIIILIILTILSACINRVDKTGYMFENIDFSSIKKGVTSKNTIINNYSNPTLIMETNNQELWIYYSEDVNNFLFFKPNAIKRDIVAIKFDGDDRVSDIKRLELKDEDKKFFFNTNKTFVQNHNVNFFKSIYDNIGAVRPQ